MEEKNEQIQKLVTDYCNKHLDSAYREICIKVHQDLLKTDQFIFARGNPEIWAAAIVWAIGSENFLSDKSFKPYAKLSDVCAFFNANTSTVGQKSRKIKNMLEIDIWNPEYRLPGSELGAFLDSLAMTKEGIIVPRDMLYEEEEPDKTDAEIVEEEATPEYYHLIFKPVKKVATAMFYQLEYQLKKLLQNDESYVKSGIAEGGKFSFTFFGWWDSVEKIQEYSHTKTDFVVSDIYFADSLEDLD
ncbi:MAG: hypothetical protein JW761_13530, partial [Prolixibacteraceae bacterium]|nr:hypothetical protein [Prolixibacteraceae bacterium]